MKKGLFVCMIFAISVLSTTNTKAQQIKIGIFDEQTVLSLIPGIQQRVDSALQRYMDDSLRVEYDYTIDDYKRTDSAYKKDSATMSAAKKGYVQKQLATAFQKIQGWQQYQNQKIQGKEQEFLKPYLEKIFNALQEIVTEQKYTHVFKADAFHPYVQTPINDNLSIKVAQKMKLKLPQEVEDALKAAQGGGGSKAPVKTPGKN